MPALIKGECRTCDEIFFERREAFAHARKTTHFVDVSMSKATPPVSHEDTPVVRATLDNRERWV